MDRNRRSRRRRQHHPPSRRPLHSTTRSRTNHARSGPHHRDSAPTSPTRLKKQGPPKTDPAFTFCSAPPRLRGERVRSQISNFHPSRYSLFTNLFASATFVTLRFGPSHSNFRPSLIAIFPRIMHSHIGPA